MGSRVLRCTAEEDAEHFSKHIGFIYLLPALFATTGFTISVMPARFLKKKADQDNQVAQGATWGTRPKTRGLSMAPPQKMPVCHCSVFSPPVFKTDCRPD
jgi:hypothetical protein